MSRPRHLYYHEGPALHAYAGPAGHKRLVRIQTPDDEVWHYEGPKGYERLVRKLGV